MYGKVNEVCAKLLREFSPQDNIALLIWTPLAVEEFSEDLEPTKEEVLYILQEIGETDEDAHSATGLVRPLCEKHWRCTAKNSKTKRPSPYPMSYCQR